MGIERDDASSPEGISPEAAHNSFLGRLGNVPVFELLDVSEDCVWVVDLAAFATWRQWLADEEHQYLRIEFESFDEEQALALAIENPEMLKNDEQQTTADRAAAIRSRVYLKVRERFEISVRDARAAHLLKITQELQ